jgi:hypothetical protein
MMALLAPALSSRRVHMAGTPCRGRLGPVVVKGRSVTSRELSVGSVGHSRALYRAGLKIRGPQEGRSKALMCPR